MEDEAEEERPIGEKNLRRVIELLDTVIKDTESQHIAEAIIRVSTFTRLGMNHTCCTYDHSEEGCEVGREILDGEYRLVRVMDPTDINEIREEDRHLASLLENLMEEFEMKLKQQDMSFKEFFYEYWWRRMDEVEQEREEIPDADLQAMRDIGVILHE